MIKKTFCTLVVILAVSVLVSELSLLSEKSQVAILIMYFLAGLGVGSIGYLEGTYTGSRAFMLIFLWPGVIVHSWQEWFMEGSFVDQQNK